MKFRLLKGILLFVLLLILGFWYQFSNSEVLTPGSSIPIHQKLPAKYANWPNWAVGSPQWFSWLKTLTPLQQSEVLTQLESEMYSSTPTTKDWKNVSVTAGPGQVGIDLFPCKVLRNYMHLLQPRDGLVRGWTPVFNYTNG